MAATAVAGPSSPTKGPDPFLVNLKLKHVIAHLCFTWDLGLEVPEGQSPTKLPPLRRDCLSKIKFLCWREVIDEPLKKFEAEADSLYLRWVRKPKAERGVVPEVTSHKPRPVTDAERDQLLQCLLDILQEESQRTPKRSFNAKSLSFNGTESRPITFSLGPKTAVRPKRPSEEGFDDLETSSKKMKQPEGTSSAEVMGPKTLNAMLPPDRGRPRRKASIVTRSVDTSFASNTSSIFSRQSLGNSMFQNTQDTVPNDEDDIPTQPNTRASSPVQKQQSSDFGEDSSFEADLANAKDANGILLATEIRDSHVDEGLSQGLNDYTLEAPVVDSVVGLIKDRLKEAFPTLPDSLRKVPFRVIYEITRVFLHTDVSMKGLKLPISQPLDDYDSLWQFLKDLPVLKGKPFPERCSKHVWDAALGNFERGFRGVILSGSLKFTHNPKPEDPLFRFQLQPIKLDLSHRLGRRFGNDRFLEIKLPLFSGRQIPKILGGLEDQGRETLIDWLIDDTHSMLGRMWRPFHFKSERPKKKKKEANQAEEYTNRVYFFAVNGEGFELVPNPLRDPQSSPTRFMMTVQAMLELVRPTRKNVDQSFLKLFARTDLVVSKTSATVVLDRKQIIRKDDIKYNGEVMTDGAGRISPALALNVTQILGLSYPPSGFQARIGEAKGFWTVDYRDKGGKEWIEIYESQRKWTPSRNFKKATGEADHPSHRTFEVLRFSGPLKPAELNLQFLPLLTERARDPAAMKVALSRLLEEGLQRELMELQIAMKEPQAFRKWLRDSNNSITERLKSGVVPYRAGLPVTTHERLNMMLDAGFEPTKISIMKDFARTSFVNKCDDLKRKLNITVSKSTYAYMVPDFAGVLEPDEVYIDFSSFVDNVSGLSGVLLNAVDVLVARSPAHYVSDIQKVKAVIKVELIGLKDVIVFSTRGNPSLAGKLSGGDYDGDIAWVCWEPEIVDNFESADVPVAPDLVKEGLIHKNRQTYGELVEGQPDPTSKFLKESFKFNMQQDMLGICTKFKERVCYNQGSVNTPEAVYLSTLLSSLVDQAKQGYTFTEDDWNRFKKEIVKIQPKQPSYETDRVDPNSTHIIDHLMIVASKTIDKALTEFQDNLPNPPHWDADLVTFYKWVQDRAESEPPWKAILKDLDSDIKAFKDDWRENVAVSMKLEDDKSMSGELKDKLAVEYLLRIDEFYERFQAILPHEDTPLTQSLLPSCLPHQELSSWALLRASALFASYRRGNSGRFPWFMAGKQLVTLKAMYCGGGFPPAVTPSMYSMLKPDAAYVKRARVKGNGDGGLVEENMSVTNADELEDLED